LGDISIGQTVSVMGTTTDGILVAETVMLMNQDLGGGQGDGRQFQGGDGRPQFQGRQNDSPERDIPPGNFGDRMIGEVVNIDSDTMVLYTIEGESVTVSLTNQTQYLSF